MILSPSVTVYLKTTETCNLNCSHCFTSGSNGKKIYFRPKKVIDFFQRLREEAPWVKTIRYIFHGGEPLLAPVDSLYETYEGLKNIFPETTFGLQTNLVFPLTPEKKDFLNKVIKPYGFGTSWDYDIRFSSERHLQLWEQNVRELLAEDHYMTLMVSITKKLIQEKGPGEVIEYATSLGFQNILFERITSDGNANENLEILPANADQDRWLHQMFQETIEKKYYDRIGNMLLGELAEAYLSHKHGGNRCRTCEQSLLTINADGSIGGCPNTAPKDFWGHIDLPIMESFKSQKRAKLISCEKFERNPLCYTCPAFEYCNSDCNKLRWEGDYCAAPKLIWKEMMAKKDNTRYRNLLLKHSHEAAHYV